MTLFARSAESKAKHETKKAEHAAKKAERKAEFQRRRAKALGRISPDELAEIPVTRERFSIEVTENIATGDMGVTKGLKYRWTVTDTATGVPQRTGYAFTHAGGHREGMMFVAKILSGKKKIK
ncbi:hypothetical protein ABZ771_34395 [Streptomyces globisporus]|uniref:hypothetical protein n=1 Tax=Streptomyces TaxID=1883 RepID=UPI0004C9255A|nr:MULTISPECIES: hypothetical protein [Streptomyces]RUP63599.1 hypothetical protein SSPNP10_34455 [Streptomyces sp. NP10]